MRRSGIAVTLASAVAVAFLFNAHTAIADRLTEELDRNADTSGWIDPHDMGDDQLESNPAKPTSPSVLKAKLKFRSGASSKVGEIPSEHEDDPEAATIKLLPKNVDGAQSSSSSGENTPKTNVINSHEELERNLADCSKKMDFLEKMAAEKQSVSGGEKCLEAIFLKRQVKLLASKLSSNGGDFATVFHVTEAEVSGLKSFSVLSNEEDWGKMPKLADTDRMLSRILENIRPKEDGHESLDFSYLPNLRDVDLESLVRIVLFVALFTVLTLMLLRGCSMWKVAVFLLAVSTVWHWTHLYKRALSKKHSALISSGGKPPSECNPGSMSWSRAIFYASPFASKGGARAHCAQYYEDLMVDPLLEVSPTMALAETISQLIVLPMEHLGRNIGKFFSSLSGELTWMSAPWVMGFVFAVFVLVLVMHFGYQIRLPFVLASFEPSKKTSGDGEKDLVIKELELQVERLSLRLSRSEEQRSLAESVSSPALVMTATSPKRSQARRSYSSTPVLRALDDSRVAFNLQETLVRELAETDDADASANASVLAHGTRVANVNASVNRSVNASSGSLFRSPRKRLVARGNIASPEDTEFEWLEEAEKEEEDEDLEDESQMVPEESAIDDRDEVERTTSFLRRVEHIFDKSSDTSY